MLLENRLIEWRIKMQILSISCKSILCLSALFLCCLTEPVRAQQPLAPAIDSEISATADFWSWTEPDSVRITVTLEETGASALAAKEALDRRTDQLAKAVRLASPSAVLQVRNSRFSGPAAPTAPLTQNSSVRAQRILGVESSQLDKTAALVDAARSAGAVSVSDVAYSVKNDSETKLRAVAMATQKAMHKAKAIAHSLGVDLGDLLSATVTEEPAGAVLRMKQQLGKDLGDYSDEDLHVYVNVRYAVKRVGR